MPLRRATTVEPIIDFDLLSVRFPMVDRKNPSGDIIWGEVSDFALQERALADGNQERMPKRVLFERYRQILEGLASDLFDDELFSLDPAGRKVVRVIRLQRHESPSRHPRPPRQDDKD